MSLKILSTVSSEESKYQSLSECYSAVAGRRQRSINLRKKLKELGHFEPKFSALES